MGLVIINDKVSMGQGWLKYQSVPTNKHQTSQKGEVIGVLTTPISSQIETSDAHLQTILNNAQNNQNQPQGEYIEKEYNEIENYTIEIESTLKQSQPNQSNQITNNLLINKNNHLSLPQLPQHSARQSKLPSNYRSIYEQDQNKVQQLYNKLLADYLPAEELNLIKKQQHKRTLILWLKQMPQSPSEQQRDKRLKGDGYQVYSTADINLLFEKYEHYEQFCLQIVVLFSYSQYYDSNQTMKELVEYFLIPNRVPQLIIVRPPQVTQLQHYKLHMKKLDINQRIIQMNYQIELIRNYILQHQPKQQSNCNFIGLSYWHSRVDLQKLIKQSTPYAAMCLKSKINLHGFTRIIGNKIIERIAQNTPSFQTLAYHYSSLYDGYMSQKRTRKQYLQNVALLMLQDPIRFYLLQNNRMMIDRLLMIVGDRLQHISCILLPIILIYAKVKEEYVLWSAKRKYKNQFRCYHNLHLSKQQLGMFETGQIIENLSFMQAQLQPQHTHHNTQLIINVLPYSTSQEHDNGYCFVSQTNTNQSVGQPINKKQYFAGYDSVLFNCLNSFRVIQKRYDSKQMKYIIELQYGYVARQMELKAMQDYIPSTEDQYKIYRPTNREVVDMAAVVKYGSNQKILEMIEDFGDCLSLVGEYSYAISYYEELYRRNKTDIKASNLILAQIQQKKGYNYELQGKNSMALDHYFKAFGYIHRGTITRQLEHIYSRTLSLMRRDSLFQRIVTFAEGIIRNGEAQNNWKCYSQHFRLQIHKYLAVAYFSITCQNYHCNASDSRSVSHFQRGLQLIKQIGEYDLDVAMFYKQLGRYYLIKRQPIDGLAYLNKCLLILRSIHGQQHPILFEIYQYLAVGYVQTHDYNRALNSVQQCNQIYKSFYGEGDPHRLPSLQLEGHIKNQLAMKNQSVAAYRRQIESLRLKYKKQIAMKTKLQLVESDAIGILRNCWYKELHAQSKRFLRKRKQVLSVAYCYTQIAAIYASQYHYNQAISELTQSIDLSKTEFTTDKALVIQINLMIAQYYLQLNLLDQFWSRIKSIWSDIERNKLQRQQVAVKYHLLVAQAYSLSSQPENAYNSAMKARQTALKTYGSSTLDYCQIVNKVASYAIKTNKINQAVHYFKQSQDIRKSLMSSITLNRHTIMLFGCDFEQYKAKVRLHLCYSIQNQAILLLQSGMHEQALVKYNECLQAVKEVVGQFHVYTAHINKELGKLYMKNEQKLAKALNLLYLALSALENMQEQPILQFVDTYSSIAQIKQKMNQLGQSIQIWSKVVFLLKKSHKLSNGIKELIQFKRLAELILSHDNQNYLRMCYYAIVSTFQEQRKNDAFLKVSTTEIAQIIGEIVNLSQKLREKITLQSQPIQQTKPIKQILTEKTHFPTLQNIKEKIEQRRKKRKAFQTPS